MNIKKHLKTLKQGDDVTFTSPDLADELVRAAAEQGIDAVSDPELEGRSTVYVVRGF